MPYNKSKFKNISKKNNHSLILKIDKKLNSTETLQITKPKKEEIMSAEDIIKKLKMIEKEFEEGNFENFDYFVDKRCDEAINYALEWSSFYGKLSLVKTTILKGANVNCSRNSSLQMASRNGHLDVVKYLIEIGHLNELPNFYVLVEAVENKHYDIVKYLLSDNNIFGIKLCDIHSEYELPLRTAIELQDKEMIKILLDNGADINTLDDMIVTSALKSENEDIIKLFRNYGAKKEYLHSTLNDVN